MTSAEIEHWLVTRIAGELHVAPENVDVRKPFTELGVDSLVAMELAMELEEHLGRRDLPVTLLFDHPTIDELARFLASDVGPG